jgi:hypothetical protein
MDPANWISKAETEFPIFETDANIQKLNQQKIRIKQQERIQIEQRKQRNWRTSSQISREKKLEGNPNRDAGHQTGERN